MSSGSPPYGKFGFIQTEPGVSSWHMIVVMYAAFVSIALATFDAFGTPYVLSEGIGVPLNEQGFIVGRLNVYTEILLLGLGQVAAFLGSTTLIGKEAPAEKRGAIVGAFSVFGAMGILIMSGVGGSLFDTVDPRAPFLVLGLMNFVVMISAIYVRLTSPGQAFTSKMLA